MAELTELTKGANAPLPATAVAVSATAAVPLDVTALLLPASGQVRSDADFVFWGNPAQPGVQYVARSLDRPEYVVVDPAAVDPAVERVVLTASVDEDVPGSHAFGAVGGLTARVDGSDGPVATFAPTGLGEETALVLLELYRRGADWKVRAVGQGYADGLGGIARDFGVDIRPPAPETATPPPSAPPPSAGPDLEPDLEPQWSEPTPVVTIPDESGWRAGAYGLPVGQPLTPDEERPEITVGTLPG